MKLRNVEGSMGRNTVLNKIERKRINEQITFEQKCEGYRGMIHGDIGKECRTVCAKALR
jgi:hypothetical protein